MKLFINSTPVATTAETIEQLVREHQHNFPSNIAIAHNGTLIHAQQWDQQTLKENDKLDVFSATAGG